MEQQKSVVRGAETRIDLDRTKKQLDDLAYLMDQAFRIPGLGWRFGIEALIGLIPGAGDVVSGAFSLMLLFRAFQFRLPKIVIFRMLFNTLLDITVGAIPLIGDAFDFVWKSNTRNMKLFHEYAAEPQKSTASHVLFLGGLVLAFMAVLVLTMVSVIWIIAQFYR